MMMCSRQECLCTVIWAVYEISKEIYTPTGWASCRLYDDGLGGVYLGTSTFGDAWIFVFHFMSQ